ncbi:MAG: hypothetical protein JXA25_01005 [Anaerolineales bacterium]|nr:hypothetical protein [Anaerolineales bacterium]
MPLKPIAAEIYTSSHRILGRITPSGRGLYSYLNNNTSSYIEIEGALLSRLHQPNRMVGRYTTLSLVKNEMLAVLLSNRMELGATGTARGGYTQTRNHWIHIILGGYELRGMIEMHGAFNFATFLLEGDTVFSPLYDATLAAILFPKIETGSAVMLFNRKKVEAIGFLPKNEQPETNQGGSN